MNNTRIFNKKPKNEFVIHSIAKKKFCKKYKCENK